jgi:hypothetical protein
MGKLFELSDGKDPRVEAEEIRVMLNGDPAPFLRHLSRRICSAEVARGVDTRAVEDLVCLLEFLSLPESDVNITTRALSVFLYNDSKRLEYLLGLFGPVLSQARKQGIPAPELSFLERSFPDTMISGKLVFEYGETDTGGREASVNDLSRPAAASAPAAPLVNAAGLILGLPLSSAAKIRAVKTIAAKENPAVLTVENKETFYALGEARRGGASRYDCFLYTGGYPNQAVAAMIRVLAASGFRFYHAGDLDPDGILILQNIRDIAGKDVNPVRMDEAAFDRYLFFARTLTKAALYQLEKIRDDTRAIPGMAGLIRRIEETGRGVEQEIIDYR